MATSTFTDDLSRAEYGATVAGLEVVFDLSSDRGGWPGPAAAVGEVWLGPLGLLDRLELELGLPRTVPSPLTRAMRLATSLAGRDGFWSASLQSDRLATAERMLADRDQLAMFGWSGEPAGERLNALWRATADAGPAMADRLARVTAALAQHRVAIGRVSTFTSHDQLPQRWRDVFAALARNGVLFETRELPSIGGAFTLLRPHGVLAAAESVAAWLAAQPSLDGTVIVSPDQALAAALMRHGLPSLGANQVAGSASLLALCVEAAFRPMDAADLHALICADPGPVPRALGWRLARALARFPGRDNAYWRKALTEGLDSLEADRRDEVAARVTALLMPMVSRDESLAASQLAARLDAFVAWAQPRCGHEPALRGAIGQAREMGELARAAGASVGLVELRRWCRAITAPETCSAAAEHGLASVAEPGAVLAAPARVIWWNCVRSRAPVIPRLRLSPHERVALAAHGVHVPAPGVLTAEVSARWRRALASSSVLLVAPRTTESGELAHPHPVVDELPQAIELPELEVPRVWHPSVPLPRALPSVQLPVAVTTMGVESASSIELLLGCSFAYAMRYRADLRHGFASSAAVPGALLAGQLQHHLFADALVQAPLADVSARIEHAFDAELPGLAETLLLPEHQAERAALRRALRDAAAVLVEAIARLGAVVGGVEQLVEGELGGVRVASRADLLLAAPAHVIDYKWGSSAHRRRLASGTAVQLAIYAALAGSHHASYLLVRAARVIGDTDPDVPHTLDAMLDATLRGLHLRRDELARGLLVAPGADGTDAVSQLTGGVMQLAPACGYCELSGLCGRRSS